MLRGNGGLGQGGGGVGWETGAQENVPFDRMFCDTSYPEPEGIQKNVRRDYVSLESKRRYFILQMGNLSQSGHCMSVVSTVG